MTYTQEQIDAEVAKGKLMVLWCVTEKVDGTEYVRYVGGVDSITASPVNAAWVAGNAVISAAHQSAKEQGKPAPRIGHKKFWADSRARGSWVHSITNGSAPKNSETKHIGEFVFALPLGQQQGDVALPQVA